MVILYVQCFMNDCPDGRMSKEKMKEMFATTVAKSKVNPPKFCQGVLSQKMLLEDVVLDLPHKPAGQLRRSVCRTIVPRL